jgi:DNA polymerase
MEHSELASIAATCTQCGLHKTRTNPVFSRGNPKAKLMVCGMVPGPDEDKAGLPFVGRAGQLLNGILDSIDIVDNEVYITNLVKCWLKPGLDLEKDWIGHCFQYILAEILMIKPKAVITLGLPASITLLGMDDKTRMGSIRGKVYGYSDQPKIEVVPTYHPSYLLRGGGVKHDKYPKVIEDFELAQYIVRTGG